MYILINNKYIKMLKLGSKVQIAWLHTNLSDLYHFSYKEK